MKVKQITDTIRRLRQTAQEARERITYDNGMVVMNSEDIGRLEERAMVLSAYLEMDGETFQSWLYQRVGL
jgi:hypothetical protein